MREIKFRGKVKGTGEWKHGSLLTYADGECNIITEAGHRIDTWNVDPDTVGQFTGLTDCKETPIYEGDVFTVNGKYPKLVEYRGDRAAFCIANADELGDKWIDPWQQPAPDWWNDYKREIAVIGNRFDKTLPAQITTHGVRSIGRTPTIDTQYDQRTSFYKGLRICCGVIRITSQIQCRDKRET